jgi:hypothetical protein
VIDDEKRYDFLESKDSREIYLYQNSVMDIKFRQLTLGIRPLFSEGMGEMGPQASTLDLRGKQTLR